DGRAGERRRPAGAARRRRAAPLRARGVRREPRHRPQRPLHRLGRRRADRPRGDGRLRPAVGRRGHVERASRGDGGGAAGRRDVGGRHGRGARGRAERHPRRAGRRDGPRRPRPRPDPQSGARSVPRRGGPAVGRREVRRAGHGDTPRGPLRDAARGAPEAGRVMAGRRRVFVVGLDAATFDLVLPWAEAGVLPTLGRLMRDGVRAPLRSTLPALTPPGWTSAATGRNPGKHNVFNFYKGTAGGLGSTPVTLGDLRSARVWDIAAHHGRRSCVLHMPLTYPPQALPGVVISGIMTPKGAEDFVAPPALKAELAAAIPGYRLEVDASPLKRGDL